MLGAFIILTFLPVFISCTGDGNIRILEEEIAEALRSCLVPGNASKETRQRRSEEYGYDEQYTDRTPRIDNNSKPETNQYGHERRNTSMREQIHVLNATDFDYGGYGAGNGGEKLVNTVPRPAINGEYNNMTAANRTRRSEPLLNKIDSDQCLSQCVFANLQVVDSRGIPRESELWARIQASVTSQQSRAALHDQTRACFQELQSEAEDNGCSYSNKLERCLMLRISDRKPNASGPQTNGQH
uniref:Odorant binding protein 16 n=1 Tax=Grapholita molesta TaxID=192188 RepID=A0A2R4SBI0_GRAMO|nr:odorant binding protein 16 [Grapholita molesta]